METCECGQIPVSVIGNYIIRIEHYSVLAQEVSYSLSESCVQIHETGQNLGF